MKLKTIFKSSVTLLVTSLLLSGCFGKELDKDGGYFNEKTGRYKFVNPSKKATRHNDLGVIKPVEGKEQQFQGKVVKIDESAKDIWIHINDRRAYQLLAELVTGLRRDDRNKNLKMSLKYVSPLASAARNKSLQARWKAFAIQTMEKELIDKDVMIQFTYAKRPKKYWAILYKTVETTKGERLRNFNRWMIYQGLSVYFFDKKDKKPQKEYLDAQRLAKKRKSGIWKYL